MKPHRAMTLVFLTMGLVVGSVMWPWWARFALVLLHVGALINLQRSLWDQLFASWLDVDAIVRHRNPKILVVVKDPTGADVMMPPDLAGQDVN